MSTQYAGAGLCDVCHAQCNSIDLCDACARSYDRHAHRSGTVLEAMVWAANRAAKMRGCTRRRGRMITISFDSDELVMLHDRVSAGVESSEENGWDDLLDKIEIAQRKLQEPTP